MATKCVAMKVHLKLRRDQRFLLSPSWNCKAIPSVFGIHHEFRNIGKCAS